MMDGLVLVNGYAPGKSWHGATVVIRDDETADQALDRLADRFEKRICPLCEHGLRQNRLWVECAAGCGFQRMVP